MTDIVTQNKYFYHIFGKLQWNKNKHVESFLVFIDIEIEWEVCLSIAKMLKRWWLDLHIFKINSSHAVQVFACLRAHNTVKHLYFPTLKGREEIVVKE